MLDASGSLGPFLDATIARTILGNTETPSEGTITHVSSAESRERYDINDGYIDFTDAETHMVLVLLRVSLRDVPLFLNYPLILSLPPLP